MASIGLEVDQGSESYQSLRSSQVPTTHALFDCSSPPIRTVNSCCLSAIPGRTPGLLQIVWRWCGFYVREGCSVPPPLNAVVCACYFVLSDIP